jgi:trans-aconitate methyltransferase
MAPAGPGLWGGGDAYEHYMGRWSRLVARVFVDWVGAPAGARWIDIGCGTGILTTAVLDRCAPSRVLGVDSSPAFLEAARSQVLDPRAAFEPGDAQAIPAGDAAFDVAAAGLLLNFVPDPGRALREMVRVVENGGRVALYVWDYPGHMQIMRHFFDVATALDPGARDFDDGVKAPFCRPAPLAALLAGAELAMVETRAIDIPTAFAGFDDYWTPFLGGTGSAPRYCMSLSEAARDRLREALRQRLPTGPDGEILLAARAWAARGRKA